MTPQPRVLFLTQKLPGGGINTHLLTLGKGLQESGWEVSLCSGGKIGHHAFGPERFEVEGIRHYTTPFPEAKSKLDQLLGIGKAFVAVNKAVRAFKPDIIHVHWPSVNIHARALQILYGIPFVTTLHVPYMAFNPAARFSSFWGERVIAVGREMHTLLTDDYGVPPDRIRSVYNGVDSHYFRPASEQERSDARSTFDISADQLVVALVGELTKRKGQRLLIEALVILRHKGLNVMALCAGQGPKETLTAFATEKGVGDLVQLLGHTDSRKVLWASDALVLPSKREAFGLAIVEAMLCGVVPIRTPAEGAYEQIAHGVNGFIVPFNNPQALATTLEQVLTKHELRHNVGNAALVTAQQKFSLQQMTQGTIKVYEEAIQARRARYWLPRRLKAGANPTSYSNAPRFNQYR